MQLRLRTKLTLVMTGLVLLVVAAVSGVYFALFLQQVLDQSENRAQDIANSTFVQIKVALLNAEAQGWRPESNSSDDIRDYVSYALGSSQGLQAELKSDVAKTSIYEVSITDNQGIILASTDDSLRGKFRERRPPLSQLTRRGFLHQVKVLAGPPGVYEYDYPFNNGNEPFGEVRVAVSSALLLNKEILPIVRNLGTIVLLALLISTILAAVVSGAALGAPGAYLRATGPHLRRPIRCADAGGQGFRRKQRRVGPSQPENHKGRAAITRSTRNLQHHAREHELRDGRPGGRFASIYARCARGHGESCRREISWRARGTISWAARDGDIPCWPSVARRAAHRGR